MNEPNKNPNIERPEGTAPVAGQQPAPKPGAVGDINSRTVTFDRITTNTEKGYTVRRAPVRRSAAQNPGAKPSGTPAPARPQPVQPQNQARPTVQGTPKAPTAAGSNQARAAAPTARPAQPAARPVSAQRSRPATPPASSQRPAVKKAQDTVPSETMATRVANIPKKKKKKDKNGGTGVKSIIKALVYIVAVLTVSVILGYFGIVIANDTFAFVKEDEEVTVTIPEYMTTSELADILYDEGIIKYPFVFKVYCGRNDDNVEFVAGDYTVNANSSYDELFGMFQKSNKRETVRVAIPEGFTVDEIIDLLVENGVGSREGFVEVINEYDFTAAGYEYSFVDAIEMTEDRFYRLEGYLYPDTYDFYKARDLSDQDELYIYTDEVVAVAKFLSRFKQIMTDELMLRADELNMTLDEVVTLASIIEKEGKYVVEFEDISSVFHNRLDHPGTYPMLQSDATIAYAMQCAEGKRPDEIVSTDKNYDHPYNTYKNAGLPPSAIANPGYNAITCALYPSKTNYYFFVSQKDGTTLFAATEEEHLNNIVIARS